jgi:SSS family solute:Na+ symporter
LPWDPTSRERLPKADYVFPIYIVTRMPHVVRGLMVAGILAAALSSLTSALTAISSVVLLDFRRARQSEAGDKDAGQGLRAARVVTTLAALLLGIIAWLAKDAPLVFNMVFQFAGIFSGAKLGAILLAMRKDAQPSLGVVCGMIASALVMALIVAASRIGWIAINWPWYPLIGTLVCVAVARLVERLGAA